MFPLLVLIFFVPLLTIINCGVISHSSYDELQHNRWIPRVEHSVQTGSFYAPIHSVRSAPTYQSQSASQSANQVYFHQHQEPAVIYTSHQDYHPSREVPTSRVREDSELQERLGIHIIKIIIYAQISRDK